jgi:DNA-binding MarR family transcriptional regulator
LEQDSGYEITWLVRRVFRAMATHADDHLQESDLTAPDRAVMEFLYPDEKLSVPEIASRYKVSRQHVQVTANRLLEKGLLANERNPRHKRSSLLRLSDLGRERFAEIRRNETVLLDRLFTDLAVDDLDATRRTLQTLCDRFSYRYPLSGRA